MPTDSNIDFFSFYQSKFGPDYYQGELNARLPEIYTLREYQTILGVGSGRAIIEDYLASIGRKVIASDINPQLVHLARNKLRFLTNYIIADCWHLPFAENSFEAVYSQGLLEHFEPEEQLVILREMWRVCSKGVIFAVPAPDYSFQDFGREYRFSKKEWQERLKNPFNNFSISTYWEELGVIILGTIHK